MLVILWLGNVPYKIFAVLHAFQINVKQTFSMGNLAAFTNFPSFTVNFCCDRDNTGLALSGKSTATPSPSELIQYHQSSGKYLNLIRSSFSEATPLPQVTYLQTSRPCLCILGMSVDFLRRLSIQHKNCDTLLLTD